MNVFLTLRTIKNGELLELPKELKKIVEGVTLLKLYPLFYDVKDIVPNIFYPFTESKPVVTTTIFITPITLG